jgi:hypothetical protein
MKLAAIGVALIALSLVLASFAGINPLYLTLAGIVCGLVGVVRDAPSLPEGGAEASPGAAVDAATLASYTYPRPDGGVGPFNAA